MTVFLRGILESYNYVFPDLRASFEICLPTAGFHSLLSMKMYMMTMTSSGIA
jgi:hypothetical protein